MGRFTISRQMAGRHGRCRRRPHPLSAIFPLALIAILVAAPPALADIIDDSFSPSWIQYYDRVGGDDRAYAVALGAGGAAYVAGTSGNALNYMDATLAKYVDGIPDPTWGGVKVWSGPGDFYDSANAVALGRGGAIYTVGTTRTPTDDHRWLIIKWSAATGTVKWVRRYGPANADSWGAFVGVDRKGNVVVVGSADTAAGRDWRVASWSAQGKLRWVWRPGGLTPDATDCFASDLQVMRDGSVYAIGYQADGAACLTVRLSTLGKKLWARTYKGPEGLGASVSALTGRPGNGVYVVGSAQTALSSRDGLAMSYTAAGKRTVFTLDSLLSIQRFFDVAVAADGSIVAGGLDASGGGPSEMHVVLYSPAGAILDRRNFEAVHTGWCGVAVDPYGGYYLTADGRDASNYGRIQTHRQSLTCGAGSWTSLWRPHTTENNKVQAIAVRGLRVVVVGSTDTGGADGADQYVIGYRY